MKEGERSAIINDFGADARLSETADSLLAEFKHASVTLLTAQRSAGQQLAIVAACADTPHPSARWAAYKLGRDAVVACLPPAQWNYSCHPVAAQSTPHSRQL